MSGNTLVCLDVEKPESVGCPYLPQEILAKGRRVVTKIRKPVLPRGAGFDLKY